MKRAMIINMLSVFLIIGNIAHADTGHMVTSDLWIRAVINTAEKGYVDVIWQKYSENITNRGDGVISGRFYVGVPGTPYLIHFPVIKMR